MEDTHMRLNKNSVNECFQPKVEKDDDAKSGCNNSNVFPKPSSVLQGYTPRESSQLLMVKIEENAILRSELERMHKYERSLMDEVEYLKMLVKASEGMSPVAVPLELLNLLQSAVDDGTSFELEMQVDCNEPRPIVEIGSENETSLQDDNEFVVETRKKKKKLTEKPKKKILAEKKKKVTIEKKKKTNTENKKTVDTKKKNTLGTEKQKKLNTVTKKTVDTKKKITLGTEKRKKINTENKKKLGTEKIKIKSTTAEKKKVIKKKLTKCIVEKPEISRLPPDEMKKTEILKKLPTKTKKLESNISNLEREPLAETENHTIAINTEEPVKEPELLSILKKSSLEPEYEIKDSKHILINEFQVLANISEKQTQEIYDLTKNCNDLKKLLEVMACASHSEKTKMCFILEKKNENLQMRLDELEILLGSAGDSRYFQHKEQHRLQTLITYEEQLLFPHAGNTINEKNSDTIQIDANVNEKKNIDVIDEQSTPRELPIIHESYIIDKAATLKRYKTEEPSRKYVEVQTLKNSEERLSGYPFSETIYNTERPDIHSYQTRQKNMFCSNFCGMYPCSTKNDLKYLESRPYLTKEVYGKKDISSKYLTGGSERLGTVQSLSHHSYYNTPY